MAWNDPGGGNRDPWGNRGGGDDSGPPDLDEALRKAKRRLSGLFGGGNGGRSGGSGGSSGGDGINPLYAWAALGIAVIVWLASGFYIVQAPERGVVTRFGAFVTVSGAGPHWHLPWPISDVEIVNVAENRSLSLQEQGMLTEDENVVVVDLSVQYDVKDAEAFLFNVNAPEQTLHQVVESVVREVIGDSATDFVITEGRGEVATRTHEMAQKIADGYGTGLNIQAVNLKNAQPPEPVQPAYEDAVKAREDRQRLINEANAVSNRIVPEARGQAAQTVEEARAYRTRVVESAEGDVSRFSALLAEYQQAPQVTRKRLYLDTMQRVLSKTGKVVVDREGEGRNMIYLPLDRMATGSGSGSGSSSSGSGLPSSSAVSGAAGSDSQSSSRGNRPDRSRESN